MKKLGRIFITYRYVIAFICFILSVGLNLHGSSISNWNKYGVSQTYYGTITETKNDFNTKKNKINIETNLKNWVSIPPREDGVIIGVPRMIRSDEWLVQTPFYLSQVSNGNPVINPSYATSGQNMLLAYNAPMNHISVIGKPFNWGFLFLGASKGLAWYWSFKLIGLILLAYEFSMILTKKNKVLSVLGSLWITFTPVIQWWFMQHLGDVVFFSLLLIVSFYHFFKAESLVLKCLFSSFIVSGMVGFTLVIYPAFQVVFAYLIIFFFLVYLIEAWKRKSLDRWDWFLIFLTFFIVVGIVGYTLIGSIEALKSTLGTIYPGSRISQGGGTPTKQMLDSFLGLILPFKIPPFSNQVELANSFHFVPFFLFSLPFIIKKDEVKKNIIGLGLLIYVILLAFYSFVGVSDSVSKITLFSFVTSSRAWQSLSVIAVFASIWFLAYIVEKSWKEKLLLLPNILITGVFFFVLSIGESDYQEYINLETLLFLLMFLAIFFILLVKGSYKLASPLFISLILVSGASVNPVVYGLNMVEEKSLAMTIKAIKHRDKDATWMTDNGFLYHFPQIFGVKSIDGVRFYPDKDLMSKIDDQDMYEHRWNRYAHIRYFLTKESTQMRNPNPDSLDIQLNIAKLSQLDVKYIITNRDLTALFGVNFKKIYGADGDGNMIFQYIKK